MAKGYIVSIHKKIIDEEKLKLYGVHAKSALEANAGRYVARGSNISKLEGIPPERCTILEFVHHRRDLIQTDGAFQNRDCGLSDR